MSDSPTILVVDDTEASRYAVGRILRQAHFQVREASSGAEALRLATEGTDLVILDIGLPDMTGYDVCRLLKSGPATSTLPVLHLSASFVRSEDRSEGLEGGADGYLTYPLEPRELVASVRALLRIRAAEQELRAQRELLRVTLSSIGDGVIATDLAGIITFINPVAQALTGWGDDGIGRPISEVFNITAEDPAIPIEDPVGEVIRHGQAVGLRNHTLLLSRDGLSRPIDDTAAPIRDEAGRAVGVVLVFRDITRRRELELEVGRRSDALAERDQRKDEFLATLAHELRNPLAPIRNAAAVLQQTSGTDRSAILQATEMITRQVDQMVRFVDDLLDLSRISLGKIELRVGWTDLGSVLSNAAEAARPLADSRRHELTVELPAEPITLNADSARLTQVVGNLLTNAVKFTNPGGRIRLSGRREGDHAVIRVKDSGIGIAADKLSTIFDMFTQLDTTLERSQSGLGIGLTLVKSLVDLHQGTIEVHSDGVGKGTEFVIRLPMLTAPTPAPAEPAYAQGTTPRRILIVDDNLDGAESLALLLTMLGHETDTANDGQTGVEVAERMHPDLILLDIGLPRLNGYEVCRSLRAQPWGKSIVVVAVTGWGQEEDKRRSREAGFDAHLVKPISIEELNELLASFPARPS
jgi:PAS domain S-box-containing protein